MSTHVPVTVVVPTIGRMPLLRTCLESIAGCDPGAEEVLVVDQSGSSDVAAAVASLERPEFTVVACERRGVAYGTNIGLQRATHDVVLVTHDDCTADGSWIGVAWSLMAKDPHRIVTGRVLPGGGDPDHVPSTITVPTARDYSPDTDFSVLYPSNMAIDRAMALRLGGFDERIPFAEDNDFCYRWLRAGHRMRYEPSLVVHHHDWRTDGDLERLYVDYAIGQGYFYAKHLRRGDLGISRHLALDLYTGARGLAAGVLHRRPRWSDSRQGLLRGLPIGLARGWRVFGRRVEGRSPRP
jgi:GT2 family glycosyltransferase